MNPLLNIDGYKLDHRRQYPDKTEYIYSNWTPRGSRILGQDHVVFLGLQYFITKYLMQDMEVFFAGDDDHISSYKDFVDSYLGNNNIGIEHIKKLRELGYIPLEFKALPEGTLTPLRVPMFTVINTHPDFFWLVNYIETILSNILWLPCTSATTAYYLHIILKDFASLTCDQNDYLKFQAHDFSFRGMSGIEAACLSGMGHLSSFFGTDTIPSIKFIKNYYPTNENYLIGCSVPATEHSVMCAGGDLSEKETFERIINLYPSGIVSIVSDTWDLWNVVDNILPKLKDQIMARDGKVVLRPDSGNPVDIICGVDGCPGIIKRLWDLFGGTINSKGYKELDQHIGVIYGDAITHEIAKEILTKLSLAGFSSSNIVFGVGSYTYQHKTRDTFGFAMKATWAQIDGKGIDIYKKPATDDGEKFSAKGKLCVNSENGKLYLKNQADKQEEECSLLKTVWKDGKFIKKYTFEEIRENIYKEDK